MFFSSDSSVGPSNSFFFAATFDRVYPRFSSQTRVAIDRGRGKTPAWKKSVVVSPDNLWEAFCILDFTTSVHIIATTILLEGRIFLSGIYP